MADVNANIGVNIDTSNALSQLKSLQKQLSQFHTSISRTSEAAALAQRDLQKNLLASINATGAFAAELRTIKTTSESFTASLEKNKFSMRQYFRFAAASTKTFGKSFTSEFDTIEKVATERVKRLQTQYIKLGRDANGAMKAIAVMPTSLNMDDYGTKVAMAAQKQQLFNQLMKQGSTNLINFGKNTQWAGRQLMVGFTIPLTILGTTATRVFMEMETQALKFRKVYGDLFTPQAETQQALADVQQLGQMFTKYGIAVSSTVGLAADAAAAGFKGIDLQRQTTEATRLSVLGQIDSQKALQTTISLQNAFGTSSEQLAGSIDFLNAVENQTVLSLDDVTTAIPKVAPIIKQLGGDVKDLAFFLTAMKEGGVNASEGANALKSGLASIINPTTKASAMLQAYGINIKNIVNSNQGDIKATVVEFAKALDTLAPLDRAKAIEQMFGKFQFARLSTLFQNVTKDGTQASRVLDLAGTSIEDLARVSEKELGITADSPMVKFKASVEQLKASLIPVGKTFLEAVTPIVKFVGDILEKFSGLSSGTKKFITLLTVGLGAVGPVLLMTFGLLANGVGNIIKLFLTLRNGYLGLTGQSHLLGQETTYMTTEQLDAAAAAHSLDQVHAKLTQQFTSEAAAVEALTRAYVNGTAASQRFAAANPGMMLPGRMPKKFAEGGIISGPGGPKSDSVPIMASNGEAILSAGTVKKYPGMVKGLIAGNIAGFKSPTTLVGGSMPGGASSGTQDVKGFKNITLFMQEWMNAKTGQQGGQGAATADVVASLKQSGAAAAAPLFAVMAKEMGIKINDPRNLEEFRRVGDLFVNSAADALANSGKEFLVDSDFESIVIPAMRDVAKGVQLAGKDMATAFERSIQEITTIGPVGAISGTNYNPESNTLTSRTGIPGQGSYKSRGSAAFDLASRLNPNVFQRQDLPSSSSQSGSKSWAMMQNIQNPVTPNIPESGKGQFVKAQMAHMAQSVTGTVAELEAQMVPYVKNLSAKLDVILKREGTQLGESLIDGIARGTKSKSPSKDAIVQGENVGDGMKIGLVNSQAKVANAAQQLGNVAIKKLINPATNLPYATDAFSPGGIAGGAGVPLNSLADQSRVTKDSLAKSDAVKKQVKLNESMDKLNRRVMGGMFALTALSGIAQTAGGNLGKLSEVAFQISGPLFAFSSILQMLTGTKMMEFVTKFKVGFGLASIALIAGVIAIKAYNSAKEKERQQVEAFTDALKTTTDQTKFLADYFSLIPQKGPLETFRAGKANDVTGSQTRTSRESLLSDPGFKKSYGSTITAVSNLSDEKAKAALTFKGLELMSQGLAKEKVQLLIDTIREEAGKKDLNLNFKDITFDDAGFGKLNAQLGVGLQGFSKKFENDYRKVKDQIDKSYASTGASKKDISKFISAKLFDEQRAALTNAATGISSYSKSLSRLTQTGQIDLKKFNSSFDTMIGTIKKQVPGSNAQLFLMRKAIMMINPELAAVTKGVSSFKDGSLLLKAATAGVSVEMITQAAIAYRLASSLNAVADANIAAGKAADLSADAAKRRNEANIAANKWTKDLQKEIAATIAMIKGFNDAANSAGNGTSTGGNDTYDFFKDMAAKIKEVTNQTGALIKLRAAGIDAAMAMEIASNPDMAKAILAIDKTSAKWKEALDAIKKYNEEKKKAEKVAIATQDQGDYELSRLKMAQAYIALTEHLIDMQNAPTFKKYNDQILEQQIALEGVNAEIKKITDAKIAPLEYKIKVNDYELQKIALAEDEINAKYDEQVKALDKIKTINEDIAAAQKNRLSLADALSRGDISAAAGIVQDERARQAAQGMSTMSTALTNSRDNQINALGRTALEKQNKQLAMDIAKIQKEKLWDLEKEAVKIQDNIDKITAEKVALERVIEKQKESIMYFGMTKAQIDAAVTALDLAKSAGIDINDPNFLNNILKGAKGDADALKLAIDAVAAAARAAFAELDRLRSGATLPGSGLVVGPGDGTPKPPPVVVDPEASDDAKKEFADSAAAAADAAAAEAAAASAEALAALKAMDALNADAQEITASMGKIAGLAVRKATNTASLNKAVGLAQDILSPESIAINMSRALIASPTMTKSLGGTAGALSTARYTGQAMKSMGLYTGGMIPKSFAVGGFAMGSDTVAARLTPGEFVMSKYAVDTHGVEKMKAINNGDSVGDSVYNYSLSVNVKSDANPDEIARSVMSHIKQIDSQRIRSSRL